MGHHDFDLAAKTFLMELERFLAIAVNNRHGFRRIMISLSNLGLSRLLFR
jgi:hypothetical protein